MIVLLIGLIPFCVLGFLFDDHSRTYHRAQYQEIRAVLKVNRNFHYACISMPCHFVLYMLNHLYVIAGVMVNK